MLLLEIGVVLPRRRLSLRSCSPRRARPLACARSAARPASSASRAPLRAALRGLHAYREHPGALAWVFVLATRRAAPARDHVAVLVRGDGICDVGFGTLLLLCPVLFLVTIVPISLNGVGLREATFVVVLASVGVAA